VVGFIFGAGMAYALRPVLQSIDLKLIITPQFAVIVFAGSIVMCLASALVSFRKVAGIDPALVFRT
jgi:putative ABC transport system permease protein